VADDGSGGTEIILESAVLENAHLFGRIIISGSGSGNDGNYTIGRVVSDTTAIAVGPYTADEAGLTWTLSTAGSFNGITYLTSSGASRFIDDVGVHPFVSGHIGHYIRRVFVSNENNQSFRINEIISTSEVDLAQLRRVEPIEADPNLTTDVDNNTTFTVSAGAVIFSSDMCNLDRAISIRDKKRYFIVSPVGVNLGRRLITSFVNTSSVLVDSAFVAETGMEYYIEVEEAYDLVTETSDWMHVKDQIIMNGTEIDLSETPTQDAGINRVFTSYGVIEPQDPTVQVFDASDGDTLYNIGMPDPHQFRLRSRTGKDTDLREDPIEITVT
jgi:hypothetical protein